MGRSKNNKSNRAAAQRAKASKLGKDGEKLSVEQIMFLTGMPRRQAQLTHQTLQRSSSGKKNQQIITIPVIPDKNKMKTYQTRQQSRINEGTEEKPDPTFLFGKKRKNRKPFKALKHFLEKDGNTKVQLEYFDNMDHLKTKHNITDEDASKLNGNNKKKKRKIDKSPTSTKKEKKKKKKKADKKDNDTNMSSNENNDDANTNAKKKKKNNKNRTQSYNTSIEAKLPQTPKNQKKDKVSESKPWINEQYLPSKNHSFSSLKYSNWFPPLSEEDEETTIGMDMLDQEIQAFSKYVSLTQDEIRARNYFLQHVTDLAMESFGKNSKKKPQNKHGRLRGDSWGCHHETNTGNDDDSDDDIRIQPFGSFATLPICNFTSDVDLALWGAVKIPRHKVFTIDSDHDEDDDDDDDDDDKGKSGVKVLSQSSLRRTMNALQNSYNDNDSDDAKETEKKRKLSRWREALSSVDIVSNNKNGVKKQEAVIILSDDDSESECSDLKKGDDNKQRNGFYSDMLKHCDESGNHEEDCEDVIDSFVIDRIGVPVDPNSIEEIPTEKKEESLQSKDEDSDDVVPLFVIDKRGVGVSENNEMDHENLAPVNKEGIQNEEVDNLLFVIDREGKHDDDVPKKEVEIEDSCEIEKESLDNPFVIDRDGVSKPQPSSISDNSKACAELVTLIDASSDGINPGDNLSIQQKDKDTEEIAMNIIEGNPFQKGRESMSKSSQASDHSSSGESHSESEDDDSADKMEAFSDSRILGRKDPSFTAMRRNSVEYSSDDSDVKEIIQISSGNSSDVEIIAKETVQVSSSSNSDIDVNDRWDTKQSLLHDNENGHLEVSGIKIPKKNKKGNEKEDKKESGPNVGASKNKASFGPTGHTRTLVIAALRTLSRKLWKSEIVQSVELRRHARVPIIALNTKLGFEGDIALGGHNGADTSHYASSQVSRFQSFEYVVLLLKTLLRQTDLDKPFTGGLGSYKLYVLVARHIENHLSTGGVDRPSEVLLSFLYRFGNVKGFSRSVNRNKVTFLSQTTVLYSDGGEADLAPVFKLDKIVQLFGLCFLRLLKRVAEINTLEPSNYEESLVDGPSLLTSIINGSEIHHERKKIHSKCLELDRLTKQSPKISRNHPGKVTTGKRVGYVFSRNESNKSPKQFKQNKEKINPGTNDSSELNTDDEAQQLISGYGLQRGPRGSLIPKKRPDVEARKKEKSMANNNETEVLRRASKNRKNKRKQTRDKALKEFADSELELIN